MLGVHCTEKSNGNMDATLRFKLTQTYEKVLAKMFSI